MCARYQPLVPGNKPLWKQGVGDVSRDGEMGTEPLCSEQKAPGHAGRSSKSTPRLWKEVPKEKLSAKCASHSPGSLHTSPFASPLPCTFASIPTLLSLPTSWTYLCCKHPFGSLGEPVAHRRMLLWASGGSRLGLTPLSLSQLHRRGKNYLALTLIFYPLRIQIIA